MSRPIAACLAAGGLMMLGCISLTNDGSLVPIASETAVIIWDPATKTQHFIRSAQFDGKGKPFGFVVPTPTKPDLTAAFESMDYYLTQAIAPKIEYRYRDGYRLSWFESPVDGAEAGAATAGAAGGVEVLGRSEVAGFDAVSLRADDAAALAAWLKKNGYASTKILEDWMADYVERRWVLTAFKVKDGVYLAPICLSFNTDTPFYPYKEPPSKPNPKGRRLRVFFFGDARYDATLAGKPWDAEVSYSGPHDVSSYELKTQEKVDILANTRLTVFEDTSNPRNGIADILFTKGKQDEVIPPPVIREADRRKPIYPTVWIPALAGLFLGGVWFARKRMRPH